MEDWQTLGEWLGSSQSPLGTRSERLREALEPCLGTGPGDLPQIKVEPEPSHFPILRVPHKDRAALTEAATEVLDGVLATEFDRVEPHLAEYVTVYWPDGTLAQHASEPLIRYLEAQERIAAPVILRDVRTYLPGELRSVLPAGRAEVISAASPAPGAIAVTAQLDSPKGSRGRAMVFAAPDSTGRWRIQTLPLPSPDDVVLSSVKASGSEDEAIRVADRVVRHWMLGRRTQLRAMRNHIMNNVWLGGELITAEQMSEDFNPAQRCDDMVFLGTTKHGRTEATDRVGPEAARAIERQSKAAWRKPWDRLKPAWTETKVAFWDPESKSAVEPFLVRCLLIGVDDVDARDEVRTRWRLAGLFDPQPPS